MLAFFPLLFCGTLDNEDEMEDALLSGSLEHKIFGGGGCFFILLCALATCTRARSLSALRLLYSKVMISEI
jgi:hypothetical protein